MHWHISTCLSLMAQCERTETPLAQKDIPARRERLRVSELKQRDALNAADGVHTGGRALGWHTVRRRAVSSFGVGFCTIRLTGRLDRR